MIPGITGNGGYGATGGLGGSDPYFSSTVLLLSGDGTNGSQVFTDESFVARGSASVENDAQVITSHKKFGTGSVRLDGLLDNLRYADSNDWNFASGDFTVEGWFSFDAANIGSVVQVLVSQWETNANRNWILSLQTTSLQFAVSTNGSAAAGAPFPLSYTWTPTADTFYHIAVDRSGTTWRMYLDGAMVDKETSSNTLFDSSAVFRVGASTSNNGTVLVNELKGNVDEIRITKGVARYASDSGYSVPTAAFPRS